MRGRRPCPRDLREAASPSPPAPHVTQEDARALGSFEALVLGSLCQTTFIPQVALLSCLVGFGVAWVLKMWNRSSGLPHRGLRTPGCEAAWAPGSGAHLRFRWACAMRGAPCLLCLMGGTEKFRRKAKWADFQVGADFLSQGQGSRSFLL